jgi:hypothetical protein
MDSEQEYYYEEPDIQDFYDAEEEIDLECPETFNSEWYSTDEEDEEEEDKEIYAGKRTRVGGRNNKKETQASKAQRRDTNEVPPKSEMLSLYFIPLPRRRNANGRKLVNIIENFSKNKIGELFEYS